MQDASKRDTYRPIINNSKYSIGAISATESHLFQVWVDVYEGKEGVAFHPLIE